MNDSDDLLVLTGNFADELAKAEPAPLERANWIIYTLKALRETTNEINYEEMLAQLRDTINNRLATGQW
jgi:hypothetical protein